VAAIGTGRPIGLVIEDVLSADDIAGSSGLFSPVSDVDAAVDGI